MKTILIIEDEPAYSQLLHDQLTPAYKVLSASDGQQGLVVAKQLHPDLILLDIRIPVLGGMEVLKELRADPYGKTANVILLTNLEPTDRILRQVTASLPAYYFIKSDVKLDDLLEKIKVILKT